MADDILGKRGKELLRRREERANQRSAEEANRISEIQRLNHRIEVNKNLQRHSDSLPPALQLSKEEEQRLQANISNMGSRLDRHKEGLESLQASRGHIAHKEFVGSVRGMSSERQIAHEMRQYSGASQTLGQASGMAQSTSTADLQSQLERQRALVGRASSRLSTTAQDPNFNEGQFLLQSRARERFIQQAGLTQQALELQRGQRLDTRSQYLDLNKAGEAISGMQQQRAVQFGVSTGAFGTSADVSAARDKTAEEFQKSLKEFNEAVKKGASNVNELGQRTRELNSKYKQQSEILAEMKRTGQGGGGGGFLSGLIGALGAGPVGDIGRMVQASGQMSRFNNVTAPMQQTQNQIGFAQLSNERFFDLNAAVTGDMSALRRVRTNLAGRQRAEAMGMAEAEDTAAMRELTGRGMQVVQKGAQALGDAVDLTSGGGGFLNRLGRGLGKAGRWLTGAGGAIGVTTRVGGEMAQDVAQLNQMSTTQQYELNTDAIAIQRANQIRQLDTAQNAVGDFGMQLSRDYYADITQATRGLGGRREGVMAQLMSAEGMGRLARQGLNRREIAQMTGQMRDAVGQQFAVSDLEEMGQFRRAGLLTTDQSIQARGMLTGVGGGQDTLKQILTEATAAGMDNSKNIMQITQATVQQAQATASLGVSTANQNAGIIGRVNQQLSGVQGNMRTGVTAAAMNFMQGASTDTGLNFSNMIRAAGLRDAGVTDSLQMDRLMRMSPQEIMAAQQARKSGNKGALIDLGIGEDVSDDQLKAALMEARKDTLNTAGGVGLLNEKHQKTLMDALEAGTSLKDLESTPEGAAALTELGKIQGSKGVSARATYGVAVGGRAAAKDINVPEGLSAGGEDLLGAEATRDYKVFSDAVKDFDRTMGGIKNLGSAVEALANLISTKEGQEVTDKAVDQRGMPASQFGQTVVQFDSSIATFTKEMNKLIDRITKARPINNSTDRLNSKD